MMSCMHDGVVHWLEHTAESAATALIALHPLICLHMHLCTRQDTHLWAGQRQCQGR